MNDPPNDSYIAALLCLGGAAGVGAHALLRRLVETSVVDVGPIVATGALAIGLFVAALLLIHDHEQQRYATNR